MHQPKAVGRLSPYSLISFNARKSIIESTRGYKVTVETCWRVVVPTLHACISNGAGNTSYCTNCSIATTVDYHVTIGQNAVTKATANF